MATLSKLLGRRPDQTGQAPVALTEPAFHQAVTQRTERRRRPAKVFSVLKLVPQTMPGTRLHPAEHAVVASVLSKGLRRGDVWCAMDDDTYLVMLNGTTDDLATTVAHRIADELLKRSSSVQKRIWHAGVAAYPRDARTEAALVRLAGEAARLARQAAREAAP